MIGSKESNVQKVTISLIYRLLASYIYIRTIYVFCSLYTQAIRKILFVSYGTFFPQEAGNYSQLLAFTQYSNLITVERRKGI